MNKDKEELLYWIRYRMERRKTIFPQSFIEVMKEDPLLVKDFFRTFSENQIVDASIDQKAIDHACIGVWIRKTGQEKLTYTVIYTEKEKDFVSKESTYKQS